MSNGLKSEKKPYNVAPGGEARATEYIVLFQAHNTLGYVKLSCAKMFGRWEWSKLGWPDAHMWEE